MFEDFAFEEQKFNPWDVKSLEEFRLYCCPECPSKTANRVDFIKHAVTEHPHSQSTIERLEDNKTEIKKELSQDESIESFTVTEEFQRKSGAGATNAVVELYPANDDSSDSSCSDSHDTVPNDPYDEESKGCVICRQQFEKLIPDPSNRSRTHAKMPSKSFLLISQNFLNN